MLLFCVVSMQNYFPYWPNWIAFGYDEIKTKFHLKKCFHVIHYIHYIIHYELLIRWEFT